MIKLLSSNLTRLAKNKFFWLGLAALFFLSVMNMLNVCRQVSSFDGIGQANLESHYFEMLPLIGIFIATVVSLFFGTEYSDGTMRNKIIIGHTRNNVYLSSIITGVIISVLLALVWFIGGLVGIPVLGVWKMQVSQVILYMLISVLSSVALSAIFVFISMTCSNKSVSAVVSIILALILMVVASMIYNGLQAPEMTSEMILTSDGKVTTTEPHPNPAYVGGTLRVALEFLLKFLPTGQAILMANLEITQPLICIICSLALTAALTVCGLIVYRKKDLK